MQKNAQRSQSRGNYRDVASIASAYPQVIWHFRERELSPTSSRKMEEKGSNYSLVLKGVGEAELGNYTCEAINKMGEESDTALLSGLGCRQFLCWPMIGLQNV